MNAAPPGELARTEDTAQFLRRTAPAYYGIIAFKLLKGALLVLTAIAAYTLSDNDLPREFQRLVSWLHFDPGHQFFRDLGAKLGAITERTALWLAAGTFSYSLFSLVEGVGLIFRQSWAGWLAVGESAFFIPIEVFELNRKFSYVVGAILVVNVFIVWYLFRHRHRLFKHHAG